MPQPHHVDLHACGPLLTSHVRRFSADTGQAGEAVITLPALDFLPRRPSWTDLGMVAADIEVWAEPPDPAGETGIVIPAARCIAPHLRSYVPFTRPRGRGRVIPVRVSAETVSLAPVRADLLARRLASDAGYALAVTENGRRVHHRIRLLGGVTQDSLANQPAAREVIRKALRSPYGANAEALIGIASSNEGGWAAKILGQRGYTGLLRASSRHAGRAGNPPAAGLPHLPAVREHHPRHARGTRRARPVRAVHRPGPLRHLHRQPAHCARLNGP